MHHRHASACGEHFTSFTQQELYDDNQADSSWILVQFRFGAREINYHHTAAIRAECDAIGPRQTSRSIDNTFGSGWALLDLQQFLFIRKYPNIRRSPFIKQYFPLMD